MFKVLKYFAFLPLVVCFFSCQSEDNEKIKLYVAASLSEPIDSLVRIYTEKTGANFELNAASSGTLARQIEQGAPASIFFSANQKWINYLIDKKLLCDSCQKVFAGNRLVLIKGKQDSSTLKFENLTSIVKKDQKLAIGDPEHVPAGIYAKEALENLGIFDSLTKSIVYAKDVRAALILVEMGEAEYAIVYKTDALASKKITIAETIDDSLYDEIKLYVGNIQTKNPQTNTFYEFLSSNEAINVLKYYGFSIPK